MSLRVLLADESDTIKKVFQLALQDLNAEVKSVHSGLDVMDVARTFKPNIVFADILLQKKNGYEICLQIKQSADLKTIPVVLMWSSFMELDQEQYKKSLASDQLEKPFDADHLREIVKKYSNTVDENPMAAFLNFPSNISTDTATPVDMNADNTIAAPLPLMIENDEQENTSEFNLTHSANSPTKDTDALTRPAISAASDAKKSLFDDLAVESAPKTNQESWKEKDLSQFKISEDKSDDLDKFEALNLSATGSTEKPIREKSEISFHLGIDSTSAVTPPPVDSEPPIDRFSLSKTVLPPHGHHLAKDGTQTGTATKSVAKPSTTTSTMTGMNDSEIEAIVRAHTEEVIKNQIKDSLLHVVEKIVREELNRIMEEELRLQQDADIDS